MAELVSHPDEVRVVSQRFGKGATNIDTYLKLDGDKSEPGTCKDRLIFEQDPHSVIEGVIIAGLAVGAQKGYIYIRGEYRYLLTIMQKAIDDAYAKGFLGDNIFGSGKKFDCYWHTGAGAYEVGEESAL